MPSPPPRSDLGRASSSSTPSKPSIGPISRRRPAAWPRCEECTGTLVRMAKTLSIATFLVGHVTKEGSLAGPRVLGAPGRYRVVLRRAIVITRTGFCAPRRTASVFYNEIGVFEMSGAGLVEIQNPSAAFLSERPHGAPGSAVICAIEGTRPLLVEVQALTSPTPFGMPRRTASGVDYNRLLVLLAVLEPACRASAEPAHDLYALRRGGVVDRRWRSRRQTWSLLARRQAAWQSPRGRARGLVLGEIGLTGQFGPCRSSRGAWPKRARAGVCPAAVVPRRGTELDRARSRSELMESPDLADALRTIV